MHEMDEQFFIASYRMLIYSWNMYELIKTNIKVDIQKNRFIY